VVFPGGFGTFDELFEVLTLLQTGKVQKRMPVVLYGEDYWKKLINFDTLVDNLMIGREDLNLMHFSNTPEEAFEYLRNELTAKFLT
jgi:predicted Rossmann-fold nucleotide-binding protein